MKAINNKILEVFLSVIFYIFSMDTLISILFLGGIAVILFTVYNINMIAFGFTLGVVLVLLSLMLLSVNSPSQKK